MRCTILQPTYIPWIGYFEMISSADVFVVYDHVQFVRKSWQQRNRVKTSNGVATLSVPVQHAPQKTRICDVRISYVNGDPLEKHWQTIRGSYKRAAYFALYESVFEEIYTGKPEYLRDLNVSLIRAICNILDIQTPIIFSSHLGIENGGTNKSDDVVALCKAISATHIYDAKGAEVFLDRESFTASGVSISFQEFTHPRYTQLWGKFEPYLSVIDLIFNEGGGSLQIIREGCHSVPE